MVPKSNDLAVSRVDNTRESYKLAIDHSSIILLILLCQLFTSTANVKYMTMHILIANFGNDSIALIEWARGQALSNLVVVSVDAGWAAPGWEERISQAEIYLKQAGIKSVRLKPEYDFEHLVRERRNFPSIKFHWCASFLKGAPILDWLDEMDPGLQSIILLAKRREQAPILNDMPEFIAEHSAYGARKVWHPLYQHSLEQRNYLIQQAGFDLLTTRSLECDPCIYNQCHDFKRLSGVRRQQLAELEKEVGRPMFHLPIEQVSPEDFSDIDVANNKSIYYQGCGSEFGCGD